MSDGASADGGAEVAAEPSAEPAPEAPEAELPEAGAEEAGAEAADAEEPEPERFAIKVNGEERSVSLDELRTLAQKGAGAHAKFEEAAALRKELEAQKAQIRQQLTSDPILRAYLTGGQDAMWSAIEEMVHYDSLPEDQRREVDQRRELERKAKRHDELEQAQREQREQQMAAQYQEVIGGAITHALESAGVRADPSAFRRMADRVSALIDEVGVSGVTRAHLARFAEEVGGRLRSDLTGSLPSEPEELVKLLEEAGRMKELRAYEAKRAKARAAGIQRTGRRRGAPAPREPEERLTVSQLMRQMKRGG